MSQFFTSNGQSIGVSSSTSVLRMNIQDWFPLGWTGWMSLHSKGLSRAFSNSSKHQFWTTFQKHQFFGPCLSLWPNSHIHIWLLFPGSNFLSDTDIDKPPPMRLLRLEDPWIKKQKNLVTDKTKYAWRDRHRTPEVNTPIQRGKMGSIDRVTVKSSHEGRQCLVLI